MPVSLVVQNVNHFSHLTLEVQKIKWEAGLRMYGLFKGQDITPHIFQAEINAIENCTSISFSKGLQVTHNQAALKALNSCIESKLCRTISKLLMNWLK